MAVKKDKAKASENPPKTRVLTTEEKLELENSLLREELLNLRILNEQKNRDLLIAKLCARILIKKGDILGWNLELGIIKIRE